MNQRRKYRPCPRCGKRGYYRVVVDGARRSQCRLCGFGDPVRELAGRLYATLTLLLRGGAA